MLAFNPPHGLTIKLPETTLGLDCNQGDACFVSHAHADHAEFGKKKPLLATAPTVELLKARKYLNKEMEVFQHKNVELAPAGHVLGSAQIKAEVNGSSLVYTGDFKLSDSLTCKGAEVLRTDVLVMEATYGHPQYTFPDRWQTYEQIAEFVNETLAAGESIVLGGYALGKAQELIAVLNEYCGIAPLTTSSIERVNQVYRDNGIPLESHVPEDDREYKHSFAAVLPSMIVSPQLAANLRQEHGRRVRVAQATGWATTGNSWGMQSFCLSDHADYNELLRYASESGASQVLLFGSFDRELAQSLRRSGIEASALRDSALDQQRLAAWTK